VGSSAQIQAMKSVAGTLRLDLNQYRELASFAQFGSDLDKATQQTLNRGERLTAILKQDELDPIPVEEQVVILFAATNGYLDEVDTDAVPDWERQFRDFMRDTHGDLLDSIRSEQQLSDEIEEKLREAVERFASNFEPEQTSLVDISVEEDEDEEDNAPDDENGEEEDQSREEEGS
jgi:F-type H+/Na+-transporting ATPase subunit alpha